MANTLITPSIVASRALATLYNTIVLAGLVWRDWEDDFTGAQGDTITVRQPATFVVDEYVRADGITVQNATEDSYTVVLDTLLDVSFAVTTEELTLELDGPAGFAERFVTPAMNAIAQDIDGRLAEALVDAANASGGGGVTPTGATTPSIPFRRARSKLSRAALPLSERYAVLSPEAVEVCLGADIFVNASASGSTDGLVEANLGRKFGFDTYESQSFGYGSGDKGGADGVAFHRSGVALTMRTLAAPNGLAPNQVAIESFMGLGLRVVQAYDNDKKQDVVSIDALCGVTRNDNRIAGVVELEFGQGS